MMNIDSFLHRFVPARTPGAPTLLLLHGTGGDENSLLELGRALSPDAALLSPRGRVLENGHTPRFFRRLAEGVFDEDDLRARTHELADFVGAAAERYGFDPSRVTAVGFSNGANIAAATLLLRPGVLRAAVLWRAMVPLTPPAPPALTGTSVLLAAGKHDPLVPRENVERLAALLRRSDAEVALTWAEAGHQLTSAEIDAARGWLVALP